MHDEFDSSDDFFSRLAVAEVPPPPEELTTSFNRRLNATLLTMQLVEFAFCAVPMAAATFIGSVVHFVLHTAVGPKK